MTTLPVRSITVAFGFETFGSQPPGNLSTGPLAESAAASSPGHCQSSRRRTETGRPRNAPASLTLHRVRPVSVPKSAPVGGLSQFAKSRRKFTSPAFPMTIKTARRDGIAAGARVLHRHAIPPSISGARTIRPIRRRTLKAPPVR
jgi:hypothetical protein